MAYRASSKAPCLPPSRRPLLLADKHFAAPYRRPCDKQGQRFVADNISVEGKGETGMQTAAAKGTAANRMIRSAVGGLAAVVLAASVGGGVVSAIGSSQAQSGGRGMLEAYHNKNRVLLVFAPGREDAHYQRQAEMLDGKDAGLNERDMVILYLLADGKGRRIGTHVTAGGDENALRRRFAVSSTQFKVVLIGKDGHTAYSAEHPVSTGQLFGLIDAMPMRREEMRRQGHKTGSAASKDAAPLAAGQSANGKANAAVSGRPSKNMTPGQVVRTQMEALQHNDTPHADAGIETTFAFASPENKQATGPLEHFIGIVKAPAYLPMLNCKSVAYDAAVISGDTARQRVHIVAANGARRDYVFMLSRQAAGPFAGCWMNDGCVPAEPEPVRDTTNDA